MSVTWVRSFNYFLLQRNFSRMVMTLYLVISHIVAFTALLMTYIVIASLAFNNVFALKDPQAYGTMALTIRTMIDITVGNYQYTYYDEKDKVHSVFIMVHGIISFIFLVNFIAAILTSTYRHVIDGGEFSYKCIKYQFFEKYQHGLIQKNGIKEIILHPSPLNLITFFLIPLSINRPLANKLGVIIAKVNFWIENIFYITLFLLYEIALSPYVQIKVFWNIFIAGTRN